MVQESGESYSVFSQWMVHYGIYNTSILRFNAREQFTLFSYLASIARRNRSICFSICHCNTFLYSPSHIQAAMHHDITLAFLLPICVSRPVILRPIFTSAMWTKRINALCKLTSYQNNSNCASMSSQFTIHITILHHPASLFSLHCFPNSLHITMYSQRPKPLTTSYCQWFRLVYSLTLSGHNQLLSI